MSISNHNLRSSTKKFSAIADTMMNSDKSSKLETENDHLEISSEAKGENSSAHSQFPTKTKKIEMLLTHFIFRKTT